MNLLLLARDCVNRVESSKAAVMGNSRVYSAESGNLGIRSLVRVTQWAITMSFTRRTHDEKVYGGEKECLAGS